jgi:hypothetical protein
MIVCLRTVGVPAAERRRYLDWITEGRTVRQDHGIPSRAGDRAHLRGWGDGGHHDLAFP